MAKEAMPARRDTTLFVSEIHAAMMKKELSRARDLEALAASAARHVPWILEKHRAPLREIYARRVSAIGEGGAGTQGAGTPSPPPAPPLEGEGSGVPPVTESGARS